MKIPLPLSKEAWRSAICSLTRLSMMTILLFWIVSLTAYAQSVQVSGKILDTTGFGLPGVTVLEKGTNTGTVTDVDGNYTITVSSSQATLVFSFVGYETQEIIVGNRTSIDLTLEESIGALDEVLVIGYGTQRERDLTSSISTIRPEEITRTPSPNAMQSLQGRVAGVQIVSNGAPGASPTVRVRGVGSFEGNAAPLYVVDGMFFDNIDFLNPNDIENISVLKDASASAIYGVRASNGVILVTTKSGAYEQAPEIVYDGYFGLQVPQNVLKMANTQQFAQYIRETGSAPDIAFLENAIQRYGRSRIDPSLPNVNTDWYAEIMGPAPIQNHNLTFNGGSAKTRYSIGGSYFSQEGLQNEIRNEYKRMNIRTKVDADIKEWLTVGGNFNFSVARQYVGEDAAWFRAYFAVPTIPVYDELNTAANPHRLSNAQRLGYRGSQNPFYPLLYTDNRNNVAKVTGNFYADLNLIPDRLDFRTSYNYSLSLVNSRNVNFAYNDGVTESPSALRRQNEGGYNQIIDNYFTYNNLWGDHMLTVTAGQSFRSEYNEVLFARGTGLSPNPTWQNEEFWYLSNSQNYDLDGIGDANGNTINSRLFYLSFFGRVAYNFDERYLLYGTYRRDGNNKFQQKWGDFFTIGAGWVITEEDFFGWDAIDFLKLRASWGQLGNDGIRPSIGAPSLEEATTALGDIRYIGRVLNPTFDLIDRWETTVEKNFGLNAKLLGNRLSIDADYFIRDTKNLAVSIIPPVFRSTERRSVGEIRNQGFELNLTWADQINDNFSYFIGANGATLKNTVQSLGGPQSLDAGSAEFRQRSIIGEPYQAFFGYEAIGVFQNPQQIESSGYTQEFIQERNLVPGDLIFKDQNGDGVINDQDRVVLGSFLPKFTYGANLGFSWKNLEFSTLIQGQSGHKILNRKRGEVIFTNDTNIDADLATNLWRGEGTSNKYPSASGIRKGWNQSFSTYFVEDGSYFRIQNVQLAYTFRDILGGKMPATRLTFTAERPLTVFNYNGFSPEVANGIDRQTYPIPAVYTLGLNVKF
jgi:TonB-linked SusC/RagA family outer membrane protein